MTPRRPERRHEDEVAVISGMSGAGRTEAAKVLEDLGFYVIDNLPSPVLKQVVDLAGQSTSVSRVAVVADIRGRAFGELVDAVGELRLHHRDVRVVFLEADDDSLVARFEASRRRHPLGETSGVEGIAEGIAREREILQELRGMADLVIDTTDLNVHELRERLVEAFAAEGDASMRINVVSFGYKYGLPRDADVVIDCRFLPNPHWVPDLRPHSGLDQPVRDYVLAQPATEPFLDRLTDLFDLLVPGFVDEGKKYLTIAIGCTGGKHRSVVIGEALAQHLEKGTGLPVHTDHRDMGRE